MARGANINNDFERGTSALTPIPTRYRGINFRSRQEARWAVLLDGLCIDWQYEPEGFQLASGWYLPDFWLPRLQCFAEVKGVAEQWSDLALKKLRDLAVVSNKSVLLFDELVVCDQHVRAYVADGALVEWQVSEFRVDLPASALQRALWFEYEPDPQTYKVLDYNWMVACSRAQQQRFEYRPRHGQ